METLNDVKKAIKPLGFKIKTRSTSFGKHATFVHAESGQELNFNVFTAELLERWKPVIEWKKSHKEELDFIRRKENIFGLM